MEFDWDDDKRRQVHDERGFDLLDAALIFEGFVVTTRDDRHDYGEERYRSVGVAGGQHFVVIHTIRDGAIRLITAWEAGRRARAQYQAGLAGRDQGDEGSG